MSRFPSNPGPSSARRPGASRRRRDHPPELITSIRAALASKHPLPLLLLASGVVDYAGALDRDPFAPDRSDRSEIWELTDSFTRVNVRETTALLTAMEYFHEGTPE